MPAIVGAFKVMPSERAESFMLDCITISPNSQVKTFAGAGSFNTGDQLRISNYKV